MMAVCGIGMPRGWRNSAVTANQSAMPPTKPALAAACSRSVAADCGERVGAEGQRGHQDEQRGGECFVAVEGAPRFGVRIWVWVGVMAAGEHAGADQDERWSGKIFHVPCGRGRDRGLNVPYPLTPAARGRANTSSGRIVLARMEHAVAAVVGGIVRRRTMFHVKHIGNGRKACLACHLSRGRLITPYPTRLAAVCDDGGLAGTTKPEDEAERQPSPLPSRQCSKGADMLLAPNRSASAHLGPIRPPE